jgi:hypothetical protein
MPRKKVPCPKCGGPKIVKAELCRKCKPTYERSEETRAKLSEAARRPRPKTRGRKRPEHSAFMREWFAEDPARLEAASERMKKVMADPVRLEQTRQQMKGERNHQWKGGGQERGYGPGFTPRLKKRIRKRDRFTCQLCAATEAALGYNFSIHHADYDKDNHAEDNLFTTCKGCNSRVNTNREHWSTYFALVELIRRQTGQHLCDLRGAQVVTQREGLVIQTLDGDPIGGVLFRLFGA